jgi:type I restriction enzyme M protein
LVAAKKDRLTNLIAIFEDKALDFSKNRAEGDDILGDAYEYLMRHFATESGKSKGQFAARMTEMEEENGGEDGSFSELDKVNKANVVARLKELKGDRNAGEETALLNEWLELSNREADLKRALKDAEADLDAKAHDKYPTLTETEIQVLVVDDKWLAALAIVIHGEMDRISQALTQRVKELAERYEAPLQQLTDKVAELEHTVEQHLEQMGFSWKLSLVTN